MPKNFDEFYDRNPMGVRRWLMKRLHKRAGDDTVRELEQELLLSAIFFQPRANFLWDVPCHFLCVAFPVQPNFSVRVRPSFPLRPVSACGTGRADSFAQEPKALMRSVRRL